MRRLITLSILAMLLSVPLACQASDTTTTDEGTSGETTTDEGGAAEETTAEETTSGAPEGPVFQYEDVPAGGTLVIGQGQEPDTLYIYGGSMLAGSHVQNSIYDGPFEGLDYDFQAVILESLPKIEDGTGDATLDLVSVEAGGQYVDPETQEVVTATETVPDLPQLTVKWHIREGVTWQDGTPVTAEDSVFSQSLACDPDTPSSKFTCDRTASYEATGDREVTWVSLPGFTDQTYFTNFYTPLPRHQPAADGTTLMADMAAGDIIEDEEFSQKPWSFGPFQIEEWESGDHITLVSNENYWRAEEGLPKLDSVIYRFIQDSNSLLAAVKTGDVDVATQDGLDINQADALDEAQAKGELTPYYITGTVWEHIDFDLDPVDGRDPIGACKEIRQAMAYGTDRGQMVSQIQKGKTRVQHTYVPEEHWAFPPSDQLITYPYEPETAKTMLEDLGFTDSNDDGMLEAAEDISCTITTDVEGNTKDQVIPAGTPLEFKLNTTAGNAMREQTTLLFQQNMKDIGVGVTLDYMPANVYFADGPEGPLFGRKFDLGEFAWLTGVQPPVGLYYCTEIPSEENSWAGQNETGWCDPEYDKAGKQASTTLKRDDSLPMYFKAQNMFMENLPVMPLFARVKVMATGPSVVNFSPNPTVNSETWNIETWGFSGQ